MNQLLTLLVATPLVLLAGCATDDTTLTAEEIRAELAARSIDFPAEVLDCVLGAWRLDAILPTIICEDELMEGESDDACFSASTHGLTPTARAAAFDTACVARAEECGAEFTFDSDSCKRTTELLTDASIGRLETCLAGPCADFDACWNGVAYCE